MFILQRIVIGLLLIAGLSARANDTFHLGCYGDAGSDENYTYDVTVAGEFTYPPNGVATSNLRVQTTGRAPDGLSYDVQNRFDEVLVQGQLTKDAAGKLSRLDIDGPYLPHGQRLKVSVPLTAPKSRATFVMERQQGGQVIGRLDCEVRKPPVCVTKQVCRRHCYPMIGCDTVCHPETTCQ
jgi:hypothetical protein